MPPGNLRKDDLENGNQGFSGASVTGAHTPGPWRISRLKSFRWNSPSTPVAEIMRDHLYEDGSVKTWVVGEVFLSTSDGTVGALEREANARIIAAAPEMFEALTMFMREHDQTYDGEPLSAEMILFIEAARAALEKAQSK